MIALVTMIVTRTMIVLLLTAGHLAHTTFFISDLQLLNHAAILEKTEGFFSLAFAVSFFAGNDSDFDDDMEYDDDDEYEDD